MTDLQRRHLRRNLFIIVLFIIVSSFTMVHEGYITMISPLFWISLVIGFTVAVWLACFVSTIRLVSLLLTIFIVEYIKETIGIREHVWTYHGHAGSYNFGVWAWVLAGVISYTLSTKLFIPLMRKIPLSPPVWLNPCIIVVVTSLIPLTLGPYAKEAGALFWGLYAIFFILGMYVSLKIDFPILAGIVITSWFVSNPSEYVGSAASGVWTFAYNPNYPPIFLLFGCWPLEILAQYYLSAYIADEPLDKDTFLKKGATIW